MGPMAAAFWVGYQLHVESWMDWTESMSLSISDGIPLSTEFIESWTKNFIWSVLA
jgi:hypothetical protein